MAIQNRRGNYTDFNGGSNLADGEFGIVMSGDPNTTDGTGTYISNGGGIVHRLATEDDISEANSALMDELYYKTGDTISGSIPCFGFVTQASREIQLHLILPKRLPSQRTVTVNSVSFQYVRVGTGGYIPTPPTLSDLAVHSEFWGVLRLSFVSASSTGATNNTVLAGWLACSLTVN